jgi:predicted metalloprotease with PDZ domain
MFRSLLIALAATGSSLAAQPAASPARATSAALSNVRYQVTFTRETAQERQAHVEMTFVVAAGRDPILLSLPAWTPGAYEITNFARWVLGFTPTSADTPLAWDKLDFDTWRIQRPAGSGAVPVTVSFDFRADTLDNAMSWSRDDFLLFNGTNVFMYPEGRSPAFASRVTIETEADWNVTTSMSAGGSARTYTATNYHDLVDMPFFVGRFDVDSAQVSGKWMRFATYPAGSVQGATRQAAWDQLKRATPPLAAVFGETPWESYTVMQIVDSSFGGASGLEHSASHVDVLAPGFVGDDFQPSLYAHEIFHAWNVKRLRPSDMWPYRYDAAMPTTWLWVSEGITDYYADLALVRSGLVSDSGFYATTAGKMNDVGATPPVALEDASLSTWVHPVDGTGYVYYPKGSLAGFMLDVLIRDASDNRKSLDDVMRQLYATTYKRGRGFTRTDWWSAVSRAAGGRSFAEFERKYVDQREPYPWPEILPLAGIRAAPLRVPRLGVTTNQGERGMVVVGVDPAGPAAAAGVRPGDLLLSINDIAVTDQSFGAKFRAAFATATEGQAITLRVNRDGQTLSLSSTLRFNEIGLTLSADPAASAKAARIRQGILRGTTDR